MLYIRVRSKDLLYTAKYKNNKSPPHSFYYLFQEEIFKPIKGICKTDIKEGGNFNMDDFARRFGGLTRKQYIELAYEIFKK